MLTETDKDQIIAGIYHGKEAMFFFLGIGTLLAIPAINPSLAEAIQLCVIGSALTLEGCTYTVEIGMNIIIHRVNPWMENWRNKRKRKREIRKVK